MFVLVTIALILLALFSVVAILRYNKLEFSLNLKWSFQAVIIGFIADFFDTLGIGSFVTTTSMFSITKYLENPRDLPGTLNTMHCLPVITEALFFVRVAKVEEVTFFSLVISAMVGSFVGSKIITHFDTRKIKLTMSIAMFATSILMILHKVGLTTLLGQGNSATSLSGVKLIIGIAGNFILGGLMSAGVGMYAPCMVMIYLLGMTPLAAFPIMMTSCATVMPVSVVTFSKEKMFQNRDLWLLIGGGVLGVIIAAVFVKSLSMDLLTWIVIAVGFYTAMSLLLSALRR